MELVTNPLQALSVTAYVVLGLVAVVDWTRKRDRARGFLALALGLLGLIIALSAVQQLMGPRYPVVLGYVSSVALLGSGYGLFLFRHHLIPYRRSVLLAVSAATLAMSIWAVTLPTQSSSKARVSAYVLLFAVLYLGFWCGMVGEPAYRLWRTSWQRPVVQRARLRALALGYALIVAVFLLLIAVIGALAGTANSDTKLSPVIGIVFQLLFLAAAPVLFASFIPPGWLRRSWRAREEERYRGATRDLLLFSPDRGTLAQRSVGWAARLVGGEGAAIIEPDGAVLAAEGIGPGLLASIAASPLDDQPRRSEAPGNLTVMVVPMLMENGNGGMVVVSGSFSPIFGGEEIERLEEYATAVAVALQRVALVEKLTESEAGLREANNELERRVQERTQQLQASNVELSATNKELEAFSYSVSHDLRAPLRAISGFAQILLAEHQAKLDEDARVYLKDIATNAEEMGSLIQDLLELSRLGRQPLSPHRVLPGDVVRWALDKLEPEMDAREIEVTVADMPACDADLVLLQQVYLNLLSNAVKFTRHRAKARIEVGAMAGETPAYFVRDNGAGFDMAYKDQLFRVFQRLHTQDEFEGIGVGLAIVQRIVARHGGVVWAEGIPDSGATFYFTLRGSAA